MSESKTPTPEPMSDERLAEIRDRLDRMKASDDYLTLPEMYALDLLAEVERLRADQERRERGGRELGKVVVHLAELIKAAFVKGETDPAGALLMLGDHLAELFEDEGGLPTDDHNRVYRALEQRRDEIARLRADLEQCRSMLRQSEQIAADLKAQVEHQRGLDEQLLAGLERDEAEQDTAREQVKRVRALSARLRSVDEVEEDALADLIDAALDGTEAVAS